MVAVVICAAAVVTLQVMKWEGKVEMMYEFGV